MSGPDFTRHQCKDTDVSRLKQRDESSHKTRQQRTRERQLDNSELEVEFVLLTADIPACKLRARPSNTT